MTEARVVLYNQRVRDCDEEWAALHVSLHIRFHILPIRERPRRIGRPALLDRQTGTDAHTRGRRALSYIRSPEILPGGYSWPRPAISVHRIYFPVDIAGLGQLYPFTGYTSRWIYFTVDIAGLGQLYPFTGNTSRWI